MLAYNNLTNFDNDPDNIILASQNIVKNLVLHGKATDTNNIQFISNPEISQTIFNSRVNNFAKQLNDIVNNLKLISRFSNKSKSSVERTMYLALLRAAALLTLERTMYLAGNTIY